MNLRFIIIINMKMITYGILMITSQMEKSRTKVVDYVFTSRTYSWYTLGKVFNAKNYTNWFRYQLFPNLYEPSFIILDNASYHKCKPSGTYNPSKMKKAEVISALESIGIDYHEKIRQLR